MARVQSQKVKAILYTLPFPITIALIGSQSIATSLTIVGLMLTGGFLWGSYFFYARLRVNILFTDIALSVLYIILAYVIVRTVKVSFWVVLALFGVCWTGLMIAFRSVAFRYVDKGMSNTNPYLKAIVIFAIAFGLFSAHQYLAAFVVTFPYNGVFAVYENRNGLLPQAALFTRNSLALAAYFTANYLVGNQHNAITRYACSWLAFVIVLVAVNSLIRIKVKTIQPA